MQLTIPAPILEQLRDELVRDDELERFAYLYCGRHGDELLVGGFEHVPQNDLEVMERGACRPDIGVERDHIASCIDQGRVPVMVHSHPFSDNPGFSGIDVSTMEDYRNWLTGLYPDEPFGFVVIGRHGLDTTVFDPEVGEMAALPVEVVGDWMLEEAWQLPSSTQDGDTIEVDPQRYDRNIRALTEQGQQRLADTRVGVIGCGGIGSLLCEELARLGVTEFTVVDPDVVETSNLPRLYGAYHHHVGRPKVEVAKEFLWRVNPDADVTAVQAEIEDCPDVLDDVDLIMAGVDQVSTRRFVNEYAVKTVTTYIDAGSLIETSDDGGEVVSMQGFVQTVVPGVTACFDCLERGDAERERVEQLSEDELQHEIQQGYVDESEVAPEPAVIHLNSSVASKAVSEFSKLVTGFDEPAGFVRFADLTNELVGMSTSPVQGCVTCGDVLGQGRVSVEDVPIEEDSESVGDDEDVEVPA